MDEGMEGEGLARGGAALSPADGSTHRAWAFFPRAVKLGGGAADVGGVPGPSSASISPHTEISYVVPPTPDTFLTRACRAGLADGPGEPAAGPRWARPEDCPLSLLWGVFS